MKALLFWLRQLALGNCSLLSWIKKPSASKTNEDEDTESDAPDEVVQPYKLLITIQPINGHSQSSHYLVSYSFSKYWHNVPL